MGIPKSHHVNLHDPLIGLGLPLPITEVEPERGFKVLSRPQTAATGSGYGSGSGSSSPVMMRRGEDEAQAPSASASGPSSRTNSGSSTPKRFMTPLVGRGRERQSGLESESTTTTTTTTTERLSGTTGGTESDLDTDSASASRVTTGFSKTHSFRDLLRGNLEDEEPPLRGTGVPVRRSLDFPTTEAAAAARGTLARPGLAKVMRAHSELRYPSAGGRPPEVDEEPREADQV